MKNTEFKDVLLELIEKNGGTGRRNLTRISQLVRDFKSDFTERYLSRLMEGHPPSEEDRIAISKVLDPPWTKWMSKYWKAEDLRSRQLAEIACAHTKSPLIAKELVESLSTDVSYRNETFSSYDTRSLMAEFFAKKKLDDEWDLFYGLS